MSWCKCPEVPRGQLPGMAADKCITAVEKENKLGRTDLCTCNLCSTGHATMSTDRGNYRLHVITVHASFLAIAPNQKSLSNYCMKALSH